MRSIRIYSRKGAEKVEPEGRWVAISITNPDEDFSVTHSTSMHPYRGHANLSEAFEDVLRLEFHDIMSQRIEKEVLFQESQANELWEFVKKWREEEDVNFLIHCEAGISRSSAVAEFIAEVIVDARIDYVENPPCFPNSFVKKMLFKVSGYRQDYIDFWKGD